MELFLRQRFWVVVIEIQSILNMKNFFYFLFFLLFSSEIVAQNATILPNKIVVPKVSSLPAFTIADKGNVVFNNTDNKMYYCDGISWQAMSVGGTNNSYNSGFHVRIASNIILNLSPTEQQIFFSSSYALYNDGGVFGPSSLLPSSIGSRRWVNVNLTILHNANQPNGTLLVYVKDKVNDTVYFSQFRSCGNGQITDIGMSGIVPANREIIVTIRSLNNNYSVLLYSESIFSGYTLY
jgi:hypothetical protein